MFKLFKNFTKKDLFLILICVILVAFQVWLDLKLPDYMSEITILVETKGSKIGDILIQGGWMLLCAFGSLISAIIVGYLASFISATFSKSIRKKLFEKVENYSMNEIKKFSTSSLITRTTNDITNIQMVISMGLQMMIKAPITAVWAVLKILNKGWEWSLATGVGVLVLVTTVVILLITVFPKFKLVQKMIDNINGLTRENLTGIRVVRAFNAENYQKNKFEKANDSLTKLQTFNQTMMSMLSPVIYLVMNLLSLAIYVIGAYLIDAANMMDKLTLFSNMIVFSSYAMQVIMAFLMLAMIFIMWPRASVSADRINEVLSTDSIIHNGKFKGKTETTGEVEFKNVSFKYPDSEEYILKDISFKAKKGDTVAFIGSTGSGKSTLINLVPRFYDATEGTITMDGVDVKEYDLETLHNKIGYVPQKAVIFNGSIKDNVIYGSNGKNEVTDTEVKEAVKIAQASDFVSKMDKGINSKVSSGGTNISGGQKQRLAIARAVARKPEIYIFDDAFSALDYKTDFTLRKELKKYTKDVTTLIVAQRIGTIKDADLIVVLEKGECVGKGTHKDLLKNCDVYKEIAYSQVSKEELENA